MLDFSTLKNEVIQTKNNIQAYCSNNSLNISFNSQLNYAASFSETYGKNDVVRNGIHVIKYSDL